MARIHATLLSMLASKLFIGPLRAIYYLARNLFNRQSKDIEYVDDEKYSDVDDV